MANVFVSAGREEHDAVEYLNNTIHYAVQERIGDIHIQNTDKKCRVRFRMPGGSLVDYEGTIGNGRVLTREDLNIIDDKIRAKAMLSMMDRMTNQSGRLSLAFDDVSVDVRVEISPAVNGGQLTVLRLLNQANSNMSLSNIHMTAAVRECFERLIAEPHGLILVTGPTGSGKTTTLYSLLHELNDESRNIVTIENPVEYRVPEFHQMNVDGEKMTWAGALRSALRQDPDVLLIGEIRDQETAHIATHAALTGHLVFATLHANNAALAVTRMVEFGVDLHTLSAALRMVTAQRLIRTLADPSSVPKEPPTEFERTWLKANGIHRQNAHYPRTLDKNAFRGSRPVMEVILADSRVKKAFKGSVDDIYAAASRQPQFETLAQAAERLAFSGQTTMAQACTVCSVQEAPVIKNRRLGQVLVDSGVVSPADMEAILNLQADSRKEGGGQRLGKMLLEADLCTHDDLINAIGFTAEAYDILERICTSEEKRTALHSLNQKWIPGLDSLFAMAIASNLITFEDLVDAHTS